MWHYAIGSQTFGPVSDEVIRSLATQGVLGPMASILPQGSASWTPLHVHETSLGLRRTAAGGYVVAMAPSAFSAGGTPPPPPPPPPPVYYPAPPSSYRQMGPATGPNGMQLAGWWSRVAAALIDGFILGIPTVILFLVIVQPKVSTDESTISVDVNNGRSFVVQLISVAIGIVYYGLMHSSESGQTVGKMALGIRVVTVDGGRLSRGRAVLRYMAWSGVVSLLTFFPEARIYQLVDALWPLWDSRNQALHDKVAHSLVVRR